MTVMVDADNSIPETSLDNNRVQPTYTVVQPATIRGIVWVDRDWDHVRDAEEIGAPVGGQGIRWILAFSQQGDVPSMQATLNPDGTYVAKVRPGSFVVEFIIGDPYEFTSSADSDLASYNNTSGYEHYGYSGVLVLSGGDEVVVDAAVVRR